MREKLSTYYGMLERAASTLQDPYLLAFRVYWGWQFAQTGWGKLQHLDKVIGFFTQLGIPLPGLNAPFIATLEFVGGILLAVGLGTRLIALLMVCNMTVAFLTADHDALFSVFSEPEKFWAASPYPFLFASVLILIFGPGRFALDSLVFKRSRPTALQQK